MRKITTMKTYFCGLTYLWILLAIPAAASTSRIYVLNNGGTTVDVIDPATNKIVQTIEGIASPNGVVFSPDKRRAYITSETEDAIYSVDTKTGKIIKKLVLSPGSADLPSISKDGSRLFICINGVRDDKGNMLSDRGGAVDVVDTTSFEKIKSLPFKGGMHDCYTTPDGKYAIAGSMGGKFFSVIDVQTEQPVWEMHFERGVLNMAFQVGSDGSTRRLIVPLNNFRGFAVVDFATHKEVTRINLPDEPSGFLLGKKLERRNITPTHGTVIAPDGKSMWVASRGSNAVFAYSIPEYKLLGYVSTPTLDGAQHPVDGGDPGWVTITADGKTVYVANAATNSVSAIDVKTMKEVARIPVGEQPDHVETLTLP
jgi:YVTN family beta-propeller protein